VSERASEGDPAIGLGPQAAGADARSPIAVADAPGPVGDQALAAPALRTLLAQTAMELRLNLRRGESVLVTLVIPIVLLVFFMSVNVAPFVGQSAIEFLLPGTLALAVMAAGLPNLGIATAYERGDGVLKRLGATPLSRGGLIGAKLLAVLLLEALQVLALLALAAGVYGWRPQGSLALAALALLLGTAAFAGLGLLMAGTLRPEATLAGANALFLLFLLVGGLFLPLGALPGWMAALGQLLPAAALADTLRATLAPGGVLPVPAAPLLAAWAVVAPLAAARTFRWE
jgi:ABC-2 type transport system permease protein